MKTENVSTLKIHKLTQAQYDRELAAGNIDENALYLTPEEVITPESIGAAAQSSLDSHTGNTTVHITSDERTKWNAAKTHADSTHAPSNAQPNQNAFSNVKVGSTTVAADTTTDTLELVAGSNVTITPDATNDKITIAATDTVYKHPTYTAREGKPVENKAPDFGGVVVVSQITSDGTGHVSSLTSRTITIPSTLSNGSTAGLIKTTSTVTSSSGHTACPVINGIPYYKDTDTKVKNTLATTTKAYVTGTTSASTNTGEQVFDTGVYLDTDAGKLTADTFNGKTFSGGGVATVSEVTTYLGI